MADHSAPDGYHGAIPYLIVNGAERAITFYTRAFDATEVYRLTDPSGKIGHAELLIGDGRIMLADEYPDDGYRGPNALGGTPVSILLYVADADACVRRAVADGATLLMEVQDQFDGDRRGKIADPFGHVWLIATRYAEVSPAEMQQRWAAITARATPGEPT